MLTIKSPAGGRRIEVQLAKVGVTRGETEEEVALFQLKLVPKSGGEGSIIPVTDGEGRKHQVAPKSIVHAFLFTHEVNCESSAELDGEFFVREHEYDQALFKQQQVVAQPDHKRKRAGKRKFKLSFLGGKTKEPS